MDFLETWKRQAADGAMACTKDDDLSSAGTVSHYWDGRADSYAFAVAREAEADTLDRWLQMLNKYAALDRADLRVLDVGTGPGFFSLLLAQHGCSVDAIDLSPEMLLRARHTTAAIADRARLHLMDAQKLVFPDDTFDVVVSRNLTWTLPDPQQAYREWSRVLRPGGTLVNFDASWYSYLVDDDVREQRESDLLDTADEVDARGEATANQCEFCEDIARSMPLTYAVRPQWDAQALAQTGLADIVIDPDAGSKLWSDVQQARYRSTPLFCISAHKPLASQTPSS
ncbi:MAG: class I SAM-dependent methyltransferase [Coriobacteriales bacterium]